LQHLPFLSLPGGACVLHGMLLLSLHSSQMVRDWCLSLLEEFELKLSSETILPNFELVLILSEFLRHNRVSNSYGYNLTDKLELYSKSFEMLIMLCEDSALNVILGDYDDFLPSFLVHLVNATSNFEHLLELLGRLVSLSNFSGPKFKVAFTKILNHKSFKAVASEYKTLSLPSRKIYFDWIINFFTNSKDNLDLLSQLPVETITWTNKHAELLWKEENQLACIVRTIIRGFNVLPHKHSIQIAEKGFLLNLQALHQAFASNIEPPFPVVDLWQNSALKTVSFRYQILALRAYTEIGFLGLLNVSKSLQSLMESIDGYICSILDQFIARNQEQQHNLLNELQERVLGLVIMTSQSVSEKTRNLIKYSTNMS
jgi:hypothetical protein